MQILNGNHNKLIEWRESEMWWGDIHIEYQRKTSQFNILEVEYCGFKEFNFVFYYLSLVALAITITLHIYSLKPHNKTFSHFISKYIVSFKCSTRPYYLLSNNVIFWVMKKTFFEVFFHKVGGFHLLISNVHSITQRKKKTPTTLFKVDYCMWRLCAFKFCCTNSKQKHG